MPRQSPCIVFHVPEATKSALELKAREMDLTVSALLRYAVRRFLSACDRSRGPLAAPETK
jgi:hypothetical protein